MTTEKTTLIVTGVARSGTTALAELLNAHDRVCVGVERFKFQFLREGNYGADLFERARFFDFQEEDTNLDPGVRPAWKVVYDAIDTKWDDALVIGDKVPDMAPILGDFMAANPGYKYIYILRNLKDVGLSWQARANRTRDKWPAGKGFVSACESWEEQQTQLHTLVEQMEDKDQLLLLDYDRMFEEDSRSDAAILNFLGLPASDGYSEMFQNHVRFMQERQRKRVPKRFVEAYSSVDMVHAKALRALSRQNVKYWVDLTPT